MNCELRATNCELLFEHFIGCLRLFGMSASGAVLSGWMEIPSSTVDEKADQYAQEELLAGLVQEYASTLYRVAFSVMRNASDAEDAVQEAFLRAWKFREALARESSFKPWLYRVVVNSCNSKLRQEIPHRDHRSDADGFDLVEVAEDASSQVAISHDIRRALKDLPVHLRIVIVLRYFADLSEREIAVAISRKPGTVKSRLNEARRRLALHPALQDDVRTHGSNEEETG